MSDILLKKSTAWTAIHSFKSSPGGHFTISDMHIRKPSVAWALRKSKPRDDSKSYNKYNIILDRLWKNTFSKFFLWSKSSLWFEYIKKRLHFCSFLKRENRKIFFICLFAPFLSSQWHHYAKNLILASISWELNHFIKSTTANYTLQSIFWP